MLSAIPSGRHLKKLFSRYESEINRRHVHSLSENLVTNLGQGLLLVVTQ
jgi:hypothetical protein